jgi:hypothetical protein
MMIGTSRVRGPRRSWRHTSIPDISGSIRLLAGDQQRLLAVGGGGDAEPLLLQVVAEKGDEIGLVLDDEDERLSVGGHGVSRVTSGTSTTA